MDPKNLRKLDEPQRIVLLLMAPVLHLRFSQSRPIDSDSRLFDTRGILNSSLDFKTAVVWANPAVMLPTNVHRVSVPDWRLGFS